MYTWGLKLDPEEINSVTEGKYITLLLDQTAKVDVSRTHS